MTSGSRLVGRKRRGASIGMALVGACAMVAACGKPSAGTNRLAALPLDPASVTVSGLSAGASMATQFHVAHSSLVNGAALAAGAPYYCSAGSIRNSLGRCMKADEPIPTSELVELTSRLALEGSIDPIAGLANDRVWIFRGALDPYVQKPVADAVEVYYQALVNPANIARVELDRAGHTFPSARADAKPCDVTEPPFVGRCDFDGAGTLLAHMYGKLGRAARPRTVNCASSTRSRMRRLPAAPALPTSGLLFVPKSCSSGNKPKCRLHVVFHGCKQGASLVGREFVLGSGYLEAAAGNDIVLLFPQIEAELPAAESDGLLGLVGIRRR